MTAKPEVNHLIRRVDAEGVWAACGMSWWTENLTPPGMWTARPFCGSCLRTVFAKHVAEAVQGELDATDTDHRHAS